VALFIDQIKSFPVQYVIWFIVIRRCGKFDIQNFEVWDDEEILNGIIEKSLYEFMR